MKNLISILLLFLLITSCNNSAVESYGENESNETIKIEPEKAWKMAINNDPQQLKSIYHPEAKLITTNGEIYKHLDSISAYWTINREELGTVDSVNVLHTIQARKHEYEIVDVFYDRSHFKHLVIRTQDSVNLKKMEFIARGRF